jgi:hypothetical protein
MKLVHESVIEGGEIFEALRTGFFEAFEKENLHTRVDLFQELAQLRHGIAAGWDAEDIVHKALDELLSHILAGKITIWEFSRSQKFVKRYRLRSKWDRRSLTGCHADDTSACDGGISIAIITLLNLLDCVKCTEEADMM